MILVGFVLFMVSVSASLVLGAFYLKFHITDLPFLGQFFGS
jgi:hypothetical protein